MLRGPGAELLAQNSGGSFTYSESALILALPDLGTGARSGGCHRRADPQPGPQSRSSRRHRGVRGGSGPSTRFPTARSLLQPGPHRVLSALEALASRSAGAPGVPRVGSPCWRDAGCVHPQGCPLSSQGSQSGRAGLASGGAGLRDLYLVPDSLSC